MPEEVNIDELIVLPNDEERVKKLRVRTPRRNVKKQNPLAIDNTYHYR